MKFSIHLDQHHTDPTSSKIRLVKKLKKTQGKVKNPFFRFKREKIAVRPPEAFIGVQPTHAKFTWMRFPGVQSRYSRKTCFLVSTRNAIEIATNVF